MNEVSTGIYSLFKTSTSHAFYTGTGGRLYQYKAPQNATFPYCVYFPVTAGQTFTFSDDQEELTYQFNIFTESNSSSSAGTLLTALKSMFDDCAITVSGWKHISFLRTMTVPNNDLSRVPPVFGFSVEYECLIEKVRS